MPLVHFQCLGALQCRIGLHDATGRRRVDGGVWVEYNVVNVVVDRFLIHLVSVFPSQVLFRWHLAHVDLLLAHSLLRLFPALSQFDEHFEYRRDRLLGGNRVVDSGDRLIRLLD